MDTGMGADDVYKPNIKFDTLYAVMQMVVPTRKSTTNDSKENTEVQLEDDEETNNITAVTPIPTTETPRRAQIVPKKKKTRSANCSSIQCD
ncbi:hypothetical protein JTB14_009324 [Gonioctena quinquepunctata]|nr:hypothetical protein JTB14_009324 [Gonioctena quinquepunctata]